MEENKASLHDVLKQETEHKQESTASSFWTFDKTDEEKPEEKKSEAPAEVKSDKKKEEDQKASAETMTSTIDAGFDILLCFGIDWKFRNNFTDEQWEKVQDLIDKNKETLEGEELELRNKYDRLKTKRDKKMKALPFDDTEINRLNRIFFNYYKVTGKELNPSVMFYMGIGSALLEKARAVLLD